MYQKVRDVREVRATDTNLSDIWEALQGHPEDWLCAIELLEISEDEMMNESIRSFLHNSNTDDVTKSLISDSLSLIQ